MSNKPITREHLSQQLQINSNANKFFALVKTDDYLDNFKLTELPEYLFDDYEFITNRGIFPVVKQITKINN